VAVREIEGSDDAAMATWDAGSFEWDRNTERRKKQRHNRL
jgi:hypothetical protein